MSLPKHLEPATYWEKRCELLEESVFRLIGILAATSLTNQGHAAAREHVAEWNRLLTELGEQHPAPAQEPR